MRSQHEINKKNIDVNSDDIFFNRLLIIVSTIFILALIYMMVQRADNQIQECKMDIHQAEKMLWEKLTKEKYPFTKELK